MLGGLGAALLLVPIKDLARTPLSASGSIGSPAYTFVKQGIPYRLRRHRFKNVTGRFRRRRNIKDQQVKELAETTLAIQDVLISFLRVIRL